MRGRLDKYPQVDPAAIDDVLGAASTQMGDQGLTIGRPTAPLAGLPPFVPGFAIDRMCAGAVTAVTAVTSVAAGPVTLCADDLAIAGGVEHRGVDPKGGHRGLYVVMSRRACSSPPLIQWSFPVIDARPDRLRLTDTVAVGVGLRARATVRRYRDNATILIVPVSDAVESGTTGKTVMVADTLIGITL